MDKRSIEIRLKNIFERYENVANSKKAYSFEMEIMYSGTMNYTPVLTRYEQQSRDINYLRSKINETMKSTDVHAYRVRKVNGLTAKAQGDMWDEFILQPQAETAAPAALKQPSFSGFAGFEIDGQPITPQGLAGFIDSKVGAIKQDYERDTMRKDFELQKMQELNALNQQLFELRFERKVDAEKIARLESEVKRLEAENEELEEEIEELEEQTAEVETLRKKAETSHTASKALGYAASKLIEKKAPALAGQLAGLFGLDDSTETEETTETAPPPPPPPPATTEPAQDERSQKIAAIVHWFKKLDDENFEKILKINIAMSNSLDKINSINELIEN